MIDHITDTAPPAVTFDPPAPGQWELETAHHGLRPLSPFLRDAYQRAFEAGIVEPMERYGLPLVTVQAKFVHGCLYMRPLAVGEKPGSTPKAPPPAFVMKLIARLHPELRRRAKTAEQAFAQRRWRRGSRPVVRPRPVSAAGEEPCAAGRRARAPSTMSSLRHTSRARCRTSSNRHAGTWRRTAAIWCPPAICWLTARGGESAPTRRPASSPAAHRRRSRRP